MEDPIGGIKSLALSIPKIGLGTHLSPSPLLLHLRPPPRPGRRGGAPPSISPCSTRATAPSPASTSTNPSPHRRQHTPPIHPATRAIASPLRLHPTLARPTRRGVWLPARLSPPFCSFSHAPPAAASLPRCCSSSSFPSCCSVSAAPPPLNLSSSWTCCSSSQRPAAASPLPCPHAASTSLYLQFFPSSLNRNWCRFSSLFTSCKIL